MELKKSKKADLQSKKALFLEIGLVVALALVLFAFEWKSSAKKEVVFDSGPQAVIEEENVPVTQEEQPKPQEIKQLPQVAEQISIQSNDIKLDMNINFNAEDSKNLGVQAMDYVEKKEVKKEEEEVEEKPIPFAVVEEKPQFMGGDANQFPGWVQSQLKYPKIAEDNGMEGIVFLSFDVEKDGSLTNIKVIRAPDPVLSDEAIRVIKTSPKWTPGKQRNKAVKVSYQFRVTFKLSS